MKYLVRCVAADTRDLWHPVVGRTHKGAAGIAKCCAVARLNSTVFPSPLPVRRKVHIRLDRYPVCSRVQAAVRRQVDAECAGISPGRDRHIIKCAHRRARQITRTNLIKHHIHRICRAGTREVLPADVNMADPPANTRYSKVVRSLRVETIELRLEILRSRRRRGGIVGLIVQVHSGRTRRRRRRISSCRCRSRRRFYPRRRR